MWTLYQLSLLSYRLAASFVSLFNEKAKAWLKGQHDTKKILSNYPKKNKFTLWIHAASLGEFEQGRPIIEKWRSLYPEHKIILTFFSPSGFLIQKDYALADVVCYLPLDTKQNATYFIETIKPDIALFIKYEYWFNYIHLLHKKKIPIYMVSAILRPNQHFFKWYGFWFRKQLKKINHFFIQNTQSAELLKDINIKQYTITGDTRFDRVIEIAANANSFKFIESFIQNNLVLIAGSTWEADEDLLSKFYHEYQKLYPLKLIIAPHQINQSHILSIKEKFGASCMLYSQLEPEKYPNYDVLIIDCIGILSQIYRYGTMAYIGGAFGKGLHNILEAATFGLPILFGPKYKKFQEAVDLVQLKGAYSVNNYEQFKDIIIPLITKENLRTETALINKTYIHKSAGSSNKIIQHLKGNTPLTI